MIVPAGMTLKQMQDLSPKSAYYQQTIEMDTFRMQAVKEAALQLGIQGGLAAESEQIDTVLDKNSGMLDTVFNFNWVLYHHNVLPPVIEESRDNGNLSGDSQSFRVGGQVYKIIHQVQFVTAPPTWRDYLWMHYPPPKLPNHVLLPENDQERDVWKAAVSRGWVEGQEQAISIYEINLHRLTRDFTGMVLYKELLVQREVSPLYVTEQAQGVTGDGNQMTIDSRLMHIQAQPQLQVYTQFWRPALMSGEMVP